MAWFGAMLMEVEALMEHSLAEKSLPMDGHDAVKVRLVEVDDA